MIKLYYVPTFKELNDYYGNPEAAPGIPSRGFMDRLTHVPVPFPLKWSWLDKTTDSIMVHRLIAPAVINAFEEILQVAGEEYLVDNKYNVCGGTYNFRLLKSGKGLSTHSWGIALDLNPDIAPYRHWIDGSLVNNQPAFITRAFINRGFSSYTHDGMHFQAVISTSGAAIQDKRAQDTINNEYRRASKGTEGDL